MPVIRPEDLSPGAVFAICRCDQSLRSIYTLSLQAQSLLPGFRPARMTDFNGEYLSCLKASCSEDWPSAGSGNAPEEQMLCIGAGGSGLSLDALGLKI